MRIIKAFFLLVFLLIVYLSGPYLWIQKKYDRVSSNNLTFFLTPRIKYGYSYLTRHYVEGSPYSFLITYNANDEDIDSFKLSEIKLISLESDMTLSFSEVNESQLKMIHPVSNSGDLKYGFVSFKIDIPYEDYQATGKFQFIGEGKVLKEGNFSVNLKKNYKKSYRVSRLLDILISG